MSKLAGIAQDMHNEALRRGESRRELARGLSIHLARVAGMFTLRLSRPAIRPSDQEIMIVRSAFDVPLAATLDESLEYTVVLRWPS